MQVELSTGSTSTITQVKLDNASASSSSTNINATNNNVSTTNTNQYVDIQAQFELSIELRKFINIDLFQRGYYQIRLSIKCANKQMPTKISLTLENSQSNNNLSGKKKKIIDNLWTRVGLHKLNRVCCLTI
jgi:hypothetical protein